MEERLATDKGDGIVRRERAEHAGNTARDTCAVTAEPRKLEHEFALQYLREDLATCEHGADEQLRSAKQQHEWAAKALAHCDFLREHAKSLRASIALLERKS